MSLQYARSHFKPERQVILLNRTRPDFTRFIYSHDGIEEYFNYFSLVKEAMPSNSDGILMLGYLYAIRGDGAKATVLLQEAYGLDPQFFFTGYNLAVVLFIQGEYLQSAGILKQTLAIPPELTFKRMMSSVIYRQIFASVKDTSEIILNLRQSYHDAYVLLVEALAKSGQYKGSQGDNADIQIHARFM